MPSRAEFITTVAQMAINQAEHRFGSGNYALQNFWKGDSSLLKYIRPSTVANQVLMVDTFLERMKHDNSECPNDFFSFSYTGQQRGFLWPICEAGRDVTVGTVKGIWEGTKWVGGKIEDGMVAGANTGYNIGSTLINGEYGLLAGAKVPYNVGCNIGLGINSVVSQILDTIWGKEAKVNKPSGDGWKIIEGPVNQQPLVGGFTKYYDYFIGADKNRSLANHTTILGANRFSLTSSADSDWSSYTTALLMGAGVLLTAYTVHKIYQYYQSEEDLS